MIDLVERQKIQSIVRCIFYPSQRFARPLREHPPSLVLPTNPLNARDIELRLLLRCPPSCIHSCKFDNNIVPPGLILSDATPPQVSPQRPLFLLVPLL